MRGPQPGILPADFVFYILVDTCKYKQWQHTPVRSMSDPQFDVERAAAGLVIALFLAASLLLGAMYYFVLRDAQDRSESSSSPQAVRVEHSPTTATAASVSASMPEPSA